MVKKWSKGDICYFSGVVSFGKSVIDGIVEDVDGTEALVSVKNGYNSPWVKKISDLFDTKEEALEMAILENSELPSILDLVSVQPMTGPTPGSISIRYKYATNSTSANAHKFTTPQGYDFKSILGAGKS